MAGMLATRRVVLWVGPLAVPISIPIFPFAVIVMLAIVNSPGTDPILVSIAIALLTGYVWRLTRSERGHFDLQQARPSAVLQGNAHKSVRHISTLRKYSQKLLRLTSWKRLFVGGVWICAFAQPITCYLANVAIAYQTVVGLQVSAIGVAVALTQMITSR